MRRRGFGSCLDIALTERRSDSARTVRNTDVMVQEVGGEAPPSCLDGVGVVKVTKRYGAKEAVESAERQQTAQKQNVGGTGRGGEEERPKDVQ
jgi:hypothetical protein